MIESSHETYPRHPEPQRFQTRHLKVHAADEENKRTDRADCKWQGRNGRP